MIEKPEAMYGEVQGVVGYWYPEMDMDVWLKPILEKAEKWDDMIERSMEAPYIDCIGNTKKLEAVKKLVEKGPSLNVDTLEYCQQVVDDWLGKLMNVLEAEE